MTVEYKYYGEDFKYKNLKVSYGGNVYHSIGRYKVPEGSIVKLEWDYGYDYHWSKASYEVSAIGSMNVIIDKGKANVTFKNK